MQLVCTASRGSCGILQTEVKLEARHRRGWFKCNQLLPRRQWNVSQTTKAQAKQPVRS
jgi:hypothetical protein